MAQSKYFRAVSARRNNVPQSDDVARGLQVGESFGKLLGGLGTAITNAKQSAARDQVANQLLAQNYPDTPADPNLDPNADMSTDLPEDVSTDVGGAASPGVQGNFQGGAAELQQRQAAAKEALTTQDLQSKIAERQAAMALDQAKASARPAGLSVTGGSASRWTQGSDGTQPGTGGGRQGKQTKPAPYVGGSGDVENDEGTDNFDQIRTDFDQQHGKGSFDAFQAQSGGAKNEDGSYSITDRSGKPMATVQASDVPMWMQRVNAARVKRSQAPIGSLGDGQNSTSTAPAGTATNPVVAQSKLHVRSLPYGTYVYDPDTKQTFIKQKPQGQ